MEYKFIARDHMGVPRVWGEGPTLDIAESRCRDELIEYMKRRPDLRTFTIEPAG